MASPPADDRNFDAEMEYTFGFFPFLKADILMLTCLLQGIRPPGGMAPGEASPQPLTYCELGCGQGVTLNVLAAGDETGRYFGIDYNPVQIKNARSLAENAGIRNVEFIEESFSNLQQHDLPDFDIVVLHGIYSWISPKLRQDIVDFLARKLKRGGICFVSYNCTIGRGSDLAFRELLQATLRREEKPSPEAISRSLTLVQALADKGARYFSSNAGTLENLKDAARRSPTYVFHEYFNPHWTPFFHHEVAAEMAGAALTYAASTNIAWNNRDLSVPSNLNAVFDSFTSSGDQELLKGVWTNQPFRRDIYVKGEAEPLTSGEQVAALEALYFGLAKDRSACPLKVSVPAGVATLPDKPFSPLLDALQKSPVSGKDLRRLLPDGAVGDRDFVRAMIVLFGVEYVELRTPPEAMEAVKRSFERLNTGVGRCVDRAQDMFLVATPHNRLAIKMNAINYFLYRAHRTGPDNRVSKAYRLLKEGGRSVQNKGQDVKDRKMAESILAEHERNFVSTILPRLTRQ